MIKKNEMNSDWNRLFINKMIYDFIMPIFQRIIKKCGINCMQIHDQYIQKPDIYNEYNLIFALLIVANGSYSEKDCQQVLMHLNQGMKANEILNMYSEDGVFLVDKISSLLDNSYVQMGSAAGRLLYKTYLKNYVEECHLFYWQGLQKQAEVEEAKKKMVEAEGNFRKAAFWNIIGCVVIFWIVVGSCCLIYISFSSRYTLQRKKID